MAHQVTQSTGNMEWYTPRYIIEAARAVMGGIDIDPASTASVNHNIVKADYFFDIEENSLSKDIKWFRENGGVSAWLNPPYGHPHVLNFAIKLVEEIENGNIGQAIWLSNNATETRWGQIMLANAKIICFPKRRVKFLDQNFKPRRSPTQGQMIVGLGPKLSSILFNVYFEEIGVIRY